MSIVINRQFGTKPKSGKLVFRYCGMEQVLFSERPFAFLQAMKSKLSKEPQYRGGELIISY